MQRFGDDQFIRFSNLIYGSFGIYFSREKKDMLQSKLLKLMVKGGIASYDELYNRLTSYNNSAAMIEFANEITINKTDFFRENNHFDYIAKNNGFITERNKRIVRNNEIRVWSAGCSTGEEIYTLAMVLKEHFLQGISIKALATDLSAKAVKRAMEGVYDVDIRNNVEKYYLIKYFHRKDDKYEVGSEIKNLVTFRLFNLMDEFPFKKGFDIIFCRNVMIYFGIEAQEQLIDKFYNSLVSGGLLFIGHSESLTNKKHRFSYVQPTIYIKS